MAGTLRAGLPPATAGNASSSASSGSGQGRGGKPRLRVPSRGRGRIRRSTPAAPPVQTAGYQLPQLVPLPAWAMPLNNTPNGELVEPTYAEALVGRMVPRGDTDGWGIWQELAGGLVRVQIRRGYRLVVGDIAPGAHTLMAVPDAPAGVGWEWVGNVLDVAVDATGKMVEGIVRLFPKAHQRMFGKDKAPPRRVAEPIVAPTAPTTPTPTTQTPTAATPLVQDVAALAAVIAQAVQAGRAAPATTVPTTVPATATTLTPAPAVGGWVRVPVGEVGCAGVGCRPKGAVGCGGSCGCGGTCGHGGA